MLRNELGLAHVIYPLSEEQFTQKWVQGLLLITKLVATASILLLQRAQEPLQNQESTLLRILFLCRCAEYAWVLSPIRGELSEGCRGENKRRCGQGGEISGEVRNGLSSSRQLRARMRRTVRLTLRNEAQPCFWP